ncbi:hypothetical protein REJC140_02879 [Pseudorhizobium endolithicum]|uniref:Uncharacterized protein n=1 Tax=Pseudorhizobium endolithicum TaxID=1191678 RepID=A0ABN7JGZ1_9HYPH|nr:hypothetical protein REQ54_03246 [Rhizobium sp. Q54]CAD7030763.1 hypothetical protein REJC140_02879 [Pseudorhizobium endolithicum]
MPRAAAKVKDCLSCVTLDVAQEMPNYIAVSVLPEKWHGSEPGAGPLWREYYGALAMSVPPAIKPADSFYP